MAEEHTLVVFKMTDKEAAHDLLDALGEAVDKYDYLRIDDAAFAYKNDDGDIDIEQTEDVEPGKGALGGGLVGILVGAIMTGPAGAIVGAASGGLLAGVYTAARDIDIDDERMKELADSMVPGEVLLFVLYEGELAPEAVDVLKSYNPELVHTTLPPETAESVRAVLSEHEVEEPYGDYRIRVEK